MNKIVPGKRVSFYEVLFFLCLLLAGGVFVKEILKNKRESKALFEPEGEGVQNTLVQALNHQPFDLKARMNLAFHYGATGQWLKSLKEYQVARRLFLSPGDAGEKTSLKGDFTPPQEGGDMLFYLAFNSAVAASALGHREEALKFYQQALAFKPRSREVKTNIELLMKNRDSQQQDSQQSSSDSEGSRSEDQKPADSASEDSQQQPSPDSDSSEDPSKEKQSAPSGEDSSKKPDFSPSLNARQVEAVLKAIEEQENKIRKKRQQETNSYRESGLQKDW